MLRDLIQTVRPSISDRISANDQSTWSMPTREQFFSVARLSDDFPVRTIQRDVASRLREEYCDHRQNDSYSFIDFTARSPHVIRCCSFTALSLVCMERSPDMRWAHSAQCSIIYPAHPSTSSTARQQKQQQPRPKRRNDQHTVHRQVVRLDIGFEVAGQVVATAFEMNQTPSAGWPAAWAPVS